MTQQQLTTGATIVMAALALVACVGGTDSNRLTCDNPTVVQGDIAEDAVGASTAIDEARQALSAIAPDRSYEGLVPANEPETIWAALTDDGMVVARVSVLEMNASFVADSVSYCRP